jgi:hypothetical protein
MTNLSKSASPSEPRGKYFGPCPWCGILLGFGHKPEECDDNPKAAEPRRDERERFEAWAKEEGFTNLRRFSESQEFYEESHLDTAWSAWAARASAAPVKRINDSTEVNMTAQQYYSEIWIKQNAEDPRGDWPIRFAEAYHEYLNAASQPQPSAGQPEEK